MNFRNTLIILMIQAFAVYASAEEQAKSVRIYLPRSKVVTSPNINMEDIAHISGMDKALSDKARAVKLGRAPFPGEKFTMSRQIILARLAADGIYLEQIKFTGAKEIHIRRESSEVASEDFINAAQGFVKVRLSNTGAVWKLTRKPADLNIVGKVKVELLCSESKTSASGQIRVVVNVVDKEHGKNIGKRELLFNLQYQTQRVVATSGISPGDIISSQNSKIELILGRKSENPSLPLGLKAVKHIQSGAIITAAMVFKPKPAILVKRNSTVQIKIIGPTWRITTFGIALQNGRFGDAIRVRNIDSKRIIVARVDKAGDVVPIMALH